MTNFRIIARFFSQVLLIEGFFMLISATISWIHGEQAANALLYSAIITFVTGLLVFTPLRNEEKVYGTREGYILYLGIWIIFSLFGTLPYLFSSSVFSFTDAFFESMSGFTTTGATVFTNVESLPKGLLFWRSLTQWIGGLTIINLSLYVLPIVKSINIQIPTTEFAVQPSGKIHPKTVEVSKRLFLVYFTLTLLQSILLMMGGLNAFDSVCHSLSTISTGGFSTRNEGIAAFSSSYLMIVVTIFMLFAAINPTVFYFTFKRDFNKIVGNSELKTYLAITISFSLLIAFVLITSSVFKISESVRAGFFHAISIISTTGYYTSDWNKWGYPLLLILFILMFSGGMTGSASGGLKISRLMIMFKHAGNESKHLIHPEAFLPVKIDNVRVQSAVVYNLLIFIIFYFIIVSFGAFLLSFFGYDLITSFSTTVSILGNIGPGIGSFGPYSGYSDMLPAAKWLLSFLMLIGRLELFAVIVLFTGNFYKK